MIEFCALNDYAKGRTSNAIDASKDLEHFGSLQEGDFICTILNVYGALPFFVQRCVRQNVSSLVCIAFYDPGSIGGTPPIACCILFNIMARNLL